MPLADLLGLIELTLVELAPIADRALVIKEQVLNDPDAIDWERPRAYNFNRDLGRAIHSLELLHGDLEKRMLRPQ
jgi:predicted nucleic acid-binding OB-fold protein